MHMTALAEMVRPEDIQLPPRKLTLSERRNMRRVHPMPRTLVEALDDMARCVVVIEKLDPKIAALTADIRFAGGTYLVALVKERDGLLEERNTAYSAYLRARSEVTQIRRRDEASTWKYTRGPRHGWG